MTSTSCVTPSRTSTVASLTCRRSVTPETQVREAKMTSLSRCDKDVHSHITILHAQKNIVTAIFFLLPEQIKKYWYTLVKMWKLFRDCSGGFVNYLGS